jgi:hypothetical protein
MALDLLAEDRGDLDHWISGLAPFVGSLLVRDRSMASDSRTRIAETVGRMSRSSSKLCCPLGHFEKRHDRRCPPRAWA